MISAPLLVLHDVGDAGGGQSWYAAFEAAGWIGALHAPDLPGHGSTPAPTGGNYELGDAVFAILPLLEELAAAPDAPVVVGIGVNGWAAQLIAVAGRASALVLADGLGGPWVDAQRGIAMGRDRLRAIAYDPDAMAPAPRSGLDPRTIHGVGAMTGRPTVERVLRELTVPLLVIESPATALQADDRANLLGECASATLIEVTDRQPTTVAAAVVRELSALTPA